MKLRTGLRDIEGSMKMRFVPNGQRFELSRLDVRSRQADGQQHDGKVSSHQVNHCGRLPLVGDADDINACRELQQFRVQVQR